MKPQVRSERKGGHRVRKESEGKRKRQLGAVREIDKYRLILY